MYADRLGYSQVSAAPALVKSGPTGFFGLIANSAVANVIVYDNTDASGTIIYNGPLTAGQVVHFGGNGVAMKRGIFVAVAAAEAVTVLYG